MKKLLIFISGIFCGILICIFAIIQGMPSLEQQRKSTVTQPVKPTSAVTTPDKKSDVKTEDQGDYVRYWESDGFKFKDVGENGVETTYVWNNVSKKWVKASTGNFDKDASQSTSTNPK